jgi:two-component system, OmpR family, phosphate regulon sensor histidine kinase PhoR
VAVPNARGVRHPPRADAIPDPRLTELRRLGILVSVFVVTPTLLLLSLGILVLVFGNTTHEVIFGVLILGLVLTMIGGIAATFAYIMREASLAKLQADFVAKVSHDLRTPLTSIRMFVETLQLGRVHEPDTYQQCLDVLATETARLSMMIDQLLGWARMEAGKRVYHPDICHVSDVVDAAVAAFGPQRLAHPVSLVLEIPANLPAVLVDRDAMVEVFINLLQNAHRYTGDDKHIAVRCSHDSGSNSIVVRVEDNGPGIAKREQVRIFEKFYRAEDPLKRELQGTGLGLAIVKHIVLGNRGQVSVESELGRGSTFRVELPVVT